MAELQVTETSMEIWVTGVPMFVVFQADFYIGFTYNPGLTFSLSATFSTSHLTSLINGVVQAVSDFAGIVADSVAAAKREVDGVCSYPASCGSLSSYTARCGSYDSFIKDRCGTCRCAWRPPSRPAAAAPSSPTATLSPAFASLRPGARGRTGASVRPSSPRRPPEADQI